MHCCLCVLKLTRERLNICYGEIHMNATLSGYIWREIIDPLRERNRQAAQRHIATLVEEGCEQGIIVTLGWVDRKEKAHRQGIEFNEPTPTHVTAAVQYPIRLPKKSSVSPILPSEYLRWKYIEPLEYRYAVRDLRYKDNIRAIGRAAGIEATSDWMRQKEAAECEGVPFGQPAPNPKSVAERLQFRYMDKGEPPRFTFPVAYFYYKFIDPSFQRWRAEGYAVGYAEMKLQI